jgi:3-phosphoshikimate 1-carboxyvinyltransferase
MADLRVVGPGAGRGHPRGIRPVEGRLRVPGDKSITHRGLLLGALAAGTTVLEGHLDGGDCRATVGALHALGVGVERHGEDALAVSGAGARGLEAPALPIDCVNSGTTMRLLAGLLAGQTFDSVLDGSEQLRRRPMARVADPLAAMGARIETSHGRAPLRLSGSPLEGALHRLSVASAQVKSALLLAGLHADGETVVVEPSLSRDHTERLLRAMGAPLSGGPGEWRVRRPDRPLEPLHLRVPGDPSSAAFPWALAAGSGGRVRVDGVGVNPTRTGFLRALERMGAGVVVGEARDEAGEPVADVEVTGAGGVRGGGGLSGGRGRGTRRTHRVGGLAGATFAGADIVAMIDELPALAVVATQADGETVVRDAGELRVKETDRIEAVVTELRRLGAAIEATADGFVVMGPNRLRGARVDGRGDHRLVMALAVAGALAEGETLIAGAECFSDSFPAFDVALRRLGVEVAWA